MTDIFCFQKKYPFSSLTVFLCLLLAGCTVGENFRRPQPPSTNSYTENPLPKQTESAPTGAGAVSRFNMGLVIMAGISIGTLFTLFVVPAMYLFLGKDRTKENTSGDIL